MLKLRAHSGWPEKRKRGSAMPATEPTDSKNKLAALKKTLVGIADQCGAESLERAVSDLLSALNYDGEILIDSSLKSLLEALRATAKELIERALKNTESVKREFRK